MSPCSFTVTRFPHLGSMPLTFELSGGFDICPLGISSHASAPPYRESVQSWGNSHVENSSAKLGGHPPPAPKQRRYYQQRLRATSVSAGQRVVAKAQTETLGSLWREQIGSQRRRGSSG